MSTRRTPPLSLDLLRGFRAAARHLSFTRAAAELSVTQSAISHEIKALESQLGRPLFARVNRALRLTQAGEQLFRAADEALALVDTATEQIAGSARTLSITTSVPFASLWLAPRLPDFARRFPDIGLRLVASNDNLDLGREHVDVAIRYAPNGATPPSNECIFDYQTFPVCSPTYLRQAAKPLASTADLASHVVLDLELVVKNRPWYDWQQWLDTREMRAFRPAGALRFSHYDQVIAAAISGSGVAIGKWPHLASQLHQKALTAPLGDTGIARLGGFYVVVASTAPRDAVEAFLSWLRAEAEGDIKRRDKVVDSKRVLASRSGKRASGR